MTREGLIKGGSKTILTVSLSGLIAMITFVFTTFNTKSEAGLAQAAIHAEIKNQSERIDRMEERWLKTNEQLNKNLRDIRNHLMGKK